MSQSVVKMDQPRNNSTMDRFSLYVVFMVLEVVNMILHTFGVYVIRSVHNPNGTHRCEHVFYLHLSIVNILTNISFFLMHLNQTINSAGLNIALPYIRIFTKTTLCYTFYSHMLYLALDRFMLVWLDMKYNFYCNASNAKHLSQLTWIIGVVLCGGMLIPHEMYPKRFQYQDPTHVMIIVYSIVFMCTALTCMVYVSYILWFKVIKENSLVTQKSKKKSDSDRENDSDSRQQDAGQLGKRKSSAMSSLCIMWTKFKSSRFYISTLLVLTFLVFTAIPDLCLYAYEMNDFKYYLSAGDVTISVFYHITFVNLFVIYVLLYEPVRNIALAKFSFKLRRKKKHTLPLLDKESSSATEERSGEECFSRIQFVSTL